MNGPGIIRIIAMHQFIVNAFKAIGRRQPIQYCVAAIQIREIIAVNILFENAGFPQFQITVHFMVMALL